VPSSYVPWWRRRGGRGCRRGARRAPSWTRTPRARRRAPARRRGRAAGTGPRRRRSPRRPGTPATPRTSGTRRRASSARWRTPRTPPAAGRSPRRPPPLPYIHAHARTLSPPLRCLVVQAAAEHVRRPWRSITSGVTAARLL
jgi:hypothetical protein